MAGLPVPAGQTLLTCIVAAVAWWAQGFTAAALAVLAASVTTLGGWIWRS